MATTVTESVIGHFSRLPKSLAEMVTEHIVVLRDTPILGGGPAWATSYRQNDHEICHQAVAVPAGWGLAILPTCTNLS